MAEVYVSVGSNIDKETNVPSGLAALTVRFGELRVSSLYESRAVGFAGANFYNLVVGFTTADSVRAVAAALGDIETRHGRIRTGERSFCRTLDLDLLLYDDLVSCEAGLQVPRAELLTHAFVLLPLTELAGKLRHPGSDATYASLWAAFDQTGQELWRVADRYQCSQNES